MLYARVTQIFRDKSKIIGYEIQTANNETKHITSEQLKTAIRQNKILLTNYKLTSDNRLIKSKAEQSSFKSDIYYLMNKDNIVAEFDLDVGITKKYSLMPLGFESIEDWIEQRTSFSCAVNVKEFFKGIGINNSKDFIDITHCVSLSDTFWVKRSTDRLVWREISPFIHNYSKVISTYALEGTNLKINEKNYFSPNIGTNGSFPHTWKYQNNKIIFIKASSKYTLGGSNSGREPYSEYYASIIADKLGFNSIKYSIRYHKRTDNRIDVVTECDCFTTEKVGSITADKLGLKTYEQVYEYCKKLNNTSADDFMNMLFLDCLLLNTDRHFSNIEFMIDNDTLEVLKLSPIFDNNYSLLPRFIEGLDIFNREDYIARDGRTFDELYSFIRNHKNFNKELIELKRFRLEAPDNVKIDSKRLKFLNKFLQIQVEWLLSK